MFYSKHKDSYNSYARSLHNSKEQCYQIIYIPQETIYTNPYESPSAFNQVLSNSGHPLVLFTELKLSLYIFLRPGGGGKGTSLIIYGKRRGQSKNFWHFVNIVEFSFMHTVSFPVLSETFLYNPTSTETKLVKTWLRFASGTVTCIVHSVPYFELQHYAKYNFASHDIA